jgi:flagellar biosynthesis protein FlhB
MKRIFGYTGIMVERLTVIFFIILCILLGIYLILAPWDALFGPWAENYLLVFIADKTGAPIIQRTVASTWFRGAVTGLGVLNLVIAFWEMAHFNQSVKMLEGEVRGDK